jgi:DNA-binding helix-hairpin-helix protein with protein kinase domain
MRLLREQVGRFFDVPPRPLGQGGEAAVFAVHDLRDQPELVAKVYHKPTDRHAFKLQAMIASPPADPMAQRGLVSIAWPTDRLLDPDRRVVGFVMPRVEGALPLFEVFNPRSRLQNCPLFHFKRLLRTAHNLAAAVQAVHDRGYVVGDLNESNGLVNPLDGLVTLVDTDSFQVRSSGHVFRCPVGKPEYTPAELQGVNFAEVDREPEHDAFALGILVFQLLMQGIHPFSGCYTGNGEPPALANRIRAGDWPYADGRRGAYRPNPHAPPWETLPASVRGLLRRCFVDGHGKPTARPAAGAWRETLRQELDRLATCSANPQHFFAAGTACPWCQLAAKQKRDPFPSPRQIKAGLAIWRPSSARSGTGTTPQATPRPVTLPLRRQGSRRATPTGRWRQYPLVIGLVASICVLVIWVAMVFYDVEPRALKFFRGVDRSAIEIMQEQPSPEEKVTAPGQFTTNVQGNEIQFIQTHSPPPANQTKKKK